MTENEEIVYSAMGLDPVLLLEEPTKHENYTVHIIRPGEEEEEVKDRTSNKNIIEQNSNNPEETKNVKEELTNLDEDRNDLISIDKISINETNEINCTETKEADEDPRRKRRRSSAST